MKEIIGMFLNQVAWVGQLTNFEEEIYNKINEVLQQKVDLGFWDSSGKYKEDWQIIDKKEL